MRLSEWPLQLRMLIATPRGHQAQLMLRAPFGMDRMKTPCSERSEEDHFPQEICPVKARNHTGDRADVVDPTRRALH